MAIRFAAVALTLAACSGASDMRSEATIDFLAPSKADEGCLALPLSPAADTEPSVTTLLTTARTGVRIDVQIGITYSEDPTAITQLVAYDGEREIARSGQRIEPTVTFALEPGAHALRFEVENFAQRSLFGCYSLSPKLSLHDPSDHDRDGIADELESTLAASFAPQLRFHPREEFLPAPVEYFLERSTMRYSKRWVTDAEVVPLGGVHQLNLNTQTYDGDVSNASDKFFLHAPEDAARRGSDPEGWRAYVHAKPASGSGIDIQYWVFFPYNNGINKHEGDWEHVTISTDEYGLLRSAWYAQHNGGEVLDEDELQYVDGTHPIAYSALGSHASYPGTGVHSDLDITGDGVQWDTWGALVNVGEATSTTASDTLNGQQFVQFAGRWGKGREQGMAGPRGPAFQPAWNTR
ncbi:MAG: Vps62-related protein [Kofleriaceae bacterium]